MYLVCFIYLLLFYLFWSILTKRVHNNLDCDFFTWCPMNEYYIWALYYTRHLSFYFYYLVMIHYIRVTDSLNNIIYDSHDFVKSWFLCVFMESFMTCEILCYILTIRFSSNL